MGGGHGGDFFLQASFGVLFAFGPWLQEGDVWGEGLGFGVWVWGEVMGSVALFDMSWF